eukprot:320103-Chlamydomonas_euryale.AAC.1
MDPETVASADLANADAYWSFENAKAEVTRARVGMVACSGIQSIPGRGAGVHATKAIMLRAHAATARADRGS